MYVKTGMAPHSLEQLFSQENVPLNMQKLNNTIIGYKKVTK